LRFDALFGKFRGEFFQLFEIGGADRAVETAVKADDRAQICIICGQIELAAAKQGQGQVWSLFAGHQHGEVSFGWVS